MTLRASTLRPLILVAAMGLALAACGRRGALEAPPTAEAQLKDRPTTTISESVLDENSFAASPLGKPARTSRDITIPKRDFILDPLL
jgi:predicted small lipoprotein YifL